MLSVSYRKNMCVCVYKLCDKDNKEILFHHTNYMRISFLWRKRSLTQGTALTPRILHNLIFTRYVENQEDTGKLEDLAINVENQEDSNINDTKSLTDQFSFILFLNITQSALVLLEN